MNIEFEVAGVKHHWHEFVRAQVKRGDFLTLRREPTNKHDPLAVAVLKGEIVIGYVPRANREVGEAMLKDRVKEVRVLLDWATGCQARVVLHEHEHEAKQSS